MGTFVPSFSPRVKSAWSTQPVTVSTSPPSLASGSPRVFISAGFPLLHFCSLTLPTHNHFITFPSTDPQLLLSILLFPLFVSQILNTPHISLPFCAWMVLCAWFLWQVPMSSLRNVSVSVRQICSYLVFLGAHSRAKFSELLLGRDSKKHSLALSSVLCSLYLFVFFLLQSLL